MNFNILATLLIFLLAIPSLLFAKEDIKQNIMSSLVEEERLEDVENDNYKVNLHNRVMFDYNFDHNYQSTDRKNEIKDSRFNGRFFSTLKFTPNLFLNSFIRFERSANQGRENIRNNSFDGGGDRAFDNHGLFFEELVLVYNKQKYSLIAGKYTLNFGKAWRQGRGIWNHQISNNYRQRENIGFGAVYHLGNRRTVGEYNFGFNLFSSDRKNLDNALISRRDSIAKSDAKAGDTRSLKSFLASLDVNFDFGKGEKLSYHFAYDNLAVNDRITPLNKNKIDDQKGFLANMRYIYPLSEDFDLDGLIEYAKIKNIDGDVDHYKKYLVASLVTRFQDNWNLTIGTSNLNDFQIGQNGSDRRQNEISAGYDFDKNKIFDRLTVQVGYKNLRINNKSSVDSQNSYGILIRYFLDF